MLSVEAEEWEWYHGRCKYDLISIAHQSIRLYFIVSLARIRMHCQV